MRAPKMPIIFLIILIAGCGGGSTSTSPPQPNQQSSAAPDITGQWDFFVVSNSGQLNGCCGVVANLQQQSTLSLFSTPANTLQFDLSSGGPAQLCALTASGEGCIFPPNLYSPIVVNAGLSNSGNQWFAKVQLPTEGTATNSYSGTVSLASSPQIQGNTAVGSENGVFVGIQMPSFSGTYSGNLSATPTPSGQGLSNFPVAVSMTLNQDQNWNITGNATFVLSGCSQTVAFSNSAAVGGTAYLNGANSTTVVAMQLMQAWPGFNTDPSDSNPNDHLFALGDPITGQNLKLGQIVIFYTGSICGASGGIQGDGGQGTITLQSNAQSLNRSN